MSEAATDVTADAGRELFTTRAGHHIAVERASVDQFVIPPRMSGLDSTP
jgi:hypothetical protein